MSEHQLEFEYDHEGIAIVTDRGSRIKIQAEDSESWTDQQRQGLRQGLEMLAEEVGLELDLEQDRSIPELLEELEDHDDLPQLVDQLVTSRFWQTRRAVLDILLRSELIDGIGRDGLRELLIDVGLLEQDPATEVLLDRARDEIEVREAVLEELLQEEYVPDDELRRLLREAGRGDLLDDGDDTDDSEMGQILDIDVAEVYDPEAAGSPYFQVLGELIDQEASDDADDLEDEDQDELEAEDPDPEGDDEQDQDDELACSYPDCGFSTDSEHGLSIHEGRQHAGESPPNDDGEDLEDEPEDELEESSNETGASSVEDDDDPAGYELEELIAATGRGRYVCQDSSCGAAFSKAEAARQHRDTTGHQPWDKIPGGGAG